MDKKAKFPQSSAKGAAGDAKKNQDVANSKLFPKTSRKREPPAASGIPKHEQPRKGNVQKAKSFDKRPKPKGLYHGGSKEDTKVVEEEPAEHGSVLVPGSKKQNLNHLLNFHYEPRDVHGGSSSWNHGKSTKGYNRNSTRWLPPIQRHKYNKEQFLQASCQFVVTANEDYSLYLANPDLLVDWKFIEQVKLYSPDSFSCPICLCAPVAGKMTRCGHVYCWPCILHYLSLSDKAWRNCPICYEFIHKDELKSVVEVTQTALNLGDTISLRLMRKEKGSLLAVPVSTSSVPPTKFFSVSENTDQQMYSKLLLASVGDVMDVIECERVQLKLELMDNPDSPENCYIEQALNELEKREQNLLKKDITSEATNQVLPSSQSPEANQDKITPEICQKIPKEPINNEDNCDSSSKEDATSQDAHATKLVDYASNETQTFIAQKFLYFYQANDGQHVYLHTVNIKMLEMQYGSLANCPHTITGKLLEKESSSLTEELRRRLRYLCHLPLNCQFEVAEIELQPPVVSEEVLHTFQDQLDARQRHRQRREREERKREKKITEKVNQSMGRFPPAKVHIESRHHFPEWQPELLFAEENASSPPESTATSSIASSPQPCTFDEIASRRSETAATHEPGVSFAEMLRNTGARAKIAWPSVSSACSKSQTCAGGVGGGHSSFRDFEEDVECIPAPSYNQSFGDALAQALEQAKLSGTGEKTSGPAEGRKKKKKKNKPTVLFATSMARPPSS